MLLILIKCTFPCGVTRMLSGVITPKMRGGACHDRSAAPRQAHELRNEIVEELNSAQVSKSGANLAADLVRGNRKSGMRNEKARKEAEGRQSEEKGSGGFTRRSKPVRGEKAARYAEGSVQAVGRPSEVAKA